MTTNKRGIELLQDPTFNKSTAFTEAEKQALGIVGLVPDVAETEDLQLSRVMMQLGHRNTLCCQWRDGPIAFFKLTTRGDIDNSVRLGGRRWGAYLRRNMRTYSSIASSPPTCLFNKPETTNDITCCSRRESVA